jgi:CRISPR-associated endonuclease/helicase Cas3
LKIYYSHPGKLLKDHLIEIYEIGKKQVSEELQEIFKIIALSHDFGKYTTFFQRHLFGEVVDKDLSAHSFISALFGAYISEKRNMGRKNIVFIYSIITNHHGNIRDLKHDFKNNISLKKENFEKQIIDIKNNEKEIMKDMKEMSLEEEFISFINHFDFEKFIKKLEKNIILLTREKDMDNYFEHQEMYSALIYSDKLSAARVKEEIPKYFDFKDYFKSFEEKIKNSDSEINKTRKEIFENIQKEIENIDEKDKILTITAPTGSGKTYSGFFAALKIKEKFNKEKIIYALPFTSIINQNYDVIKDLVEKYDDFKKNENNYIIKHHYLSSKEYKTDKERYEASQAELLIEGWNSGIIVTTFVQLFETLISTKNRYLKKYNQIKNSVIILDEIQALDVEYYPLIEKILKEISEKMNVHIIIMTATKPYIFTESKELLKDYSKYFKSFNRVDLEINIEKKSIDNFINDIKDKIENKSTMIITNTIKQSLEIYSKLKDYNPYYLSNNLLPIHRRQKIKEIKEKLQNGEKILLITTQLVEAGVDIDFELVIRDIAQLDSIIQSAGRCNRNFSKDKGKTIVYNITNEKNVSYASYIYSKTALNIVTEIFEQDNFYEEKDFSDLIEKYFKKIKENSATDYSDEMIQSIKRLNFEDEENGINRFSLIKNRPNYIDVFFRIDEEAEKVYQKYIETKSIKDFREKRNKYLEIKSSLNEYMLSIPDKYFSRLNLSKDDVLIPNLTEEACDEYYDYMTGFVREDGGDSFMIL